MSRRFAAPLVLLAAAALSLAAVFAVHRIEASGGPVGQPSVTRPFFSPNGDGIQDTTKVAFTTHDRERATVRIVDQHGHLVRELMHRRRVHGRTEPEWNGRDEHGDRVPNGQYVVRITLDGGPRVFEPITPITVDTAPPVGVIDRTLLVNGQLRGLALLEPNTRILVTVDRVERSTRNFTPNAAAISGQPRGPVPKGTVPIRFVSSVGDLPGHTLHVYAIDKAGNRAELDLVVVT